MAFERFKTKIEENTGRAITNDNLIVEVPDPCGNSGSAWAIDSGRTWRAELQRCHNAGIKEVHFWVLAREVRGMRKWGWAWLCVVAAVCFMLLRGWWTLVGQDARESLIFE